MKSCHPFCLPCVSTQLKLKPVNHPESIFQNPIYLLYIICHLATNKSVLLHSYLVSASTCRVPLPRPASKLFFSFNLNL